MSDVIKTGKSRGLRRCSTGAVLALLSTGIEWFIPARVHDGDPDQHRRARLIVLFSGTLLTLAIIYAVIFLLMISPICAITLFAGAGVALATMFVLRGSGSSRITGNMLTGTFHAVMTVLAYRLGGDGSIALPWYAGVPVVALSTVSRRASYFWLFATAASLVLFYAAEYAGYSFPNDLTPHHYKLLGLLAGIGLIALILALALLFETVKNQMLRQIQRSEKAVRLAKERSEKILQSIQNGLLIIDAETHEIVEANPAAAAMIGAAPEEIVGRTCNLSVCSAMQGACPVTDAGERIENREMELLTKDGGKTVVIKTVVPVTLEDRECLIETFVDINNLKRAERALMEVNEQLKQQTAVARGAERQANEERELLSVTLRSIADGVITTDLQGDIVLINKIAERLLGWSQQEACGRPVHEVFNIINEKTGRPCDNPVEKVLHRGMIVEQKNHIILIARNGNRYLIEDSGAPIFDENSEIIGAVLVFRDVTESRRTAEELLKVKKLESVGVLAGGIAHDFNNILTAILGNIDLAGVMIEPENKASRLLREAQKASLRAKSLTQQLLTFSRGGNPVKKTSSIGKTITESANFVLHGSQVSCRFSIPDDLWLVDFDPGQISQVIQNLVLNAKHAMPDGGEINIDCTNISDIKSETSVFLSGSTYVKIRVSDNGSGIAEKHLDKIFDPYFSTKQEGSGLGLAISHSIISKHGGHISLQSLVGEGTTFTIYLPVSEKQTVRAPTEVTDESEHVKARVLVMDDEELVRDIAERILLHLGHEVLLTADGEETISTFTKYREIGKPIDVLIMDLTIPGGMGGKDAIREILEIDPDAKAIVSSGYSNDPVLSDYRQYDFKAAIAKPFMLEEMNKTLKDVLS